MHRDREIEARDAVIERMTKDIEGLRVKLNGSQDETERGREEIERLSEELFVAKGVRGLNTSESIDVGQVYQRLENVYSIMQDLAHGRDIDLELLTSVGNQGNQGAKIKMVHFNKVLTQINALLCDVYSRKADTDSAGCQVQ